MIGETLSQMLIVYAKSVLILTTQRAKLNGKMTKIHLNVNLQPLKCNPSEYKRIMHNFKEFLDYCESFYSPSHPDVLYPIDGLTREELALATLNYLDLCAASDGTVSWGDGDSLDRERVRDFVINRRAIA